MESEDSAASVTHGTPLQRLHPLSLLFSLFGIARSLLVPGLIVWFARGGDGYEFWLMALFLPALVFAIVRYLTLRYRFQERELVLRSGILTRKERHVPFERIQNIDLEQNVFHRLFGVAKVKIETASGSDAEAQLNVLSVEHVAEIRRRVFGDSRLSHSPTPLQDGEASSRGVGSSADEETSAEIDPRAHSEADAPSEPAEREVVRLSLSDLAILGLISLRGLALVAALLGFAWELDVFERFDDEIEAFWETSATGIDVFASGLGWLLVALLVVVAFAVLQVLSIFWAWIRFYDFRLSRRGDDLRTRFGLFTRITTTIPRYRIQSIRISDTPLLRLFRSVSVRVHTAGADADNEDQKLRAWLAPVLPFGSLTSLLREVDDRVPSGADLNWRSIHTRALTRRLRLKIIASALLLGLAYAFLPIWSLAIVAAYVLISIHATIRDFRHRAFAHVGDYLIYRSGWWKRELSLVRHDKIQVVETETSPFDRRWSMGHLRVDTAGRSSFEGFEIGYLEASVAEHLAGELTRLAEGETFRW